MLVLSRKVNESIHIGSDVVVTVHSISPNQVRLCIRAPKDVRILRKELLERVNTSGPRQQSNAAKGAGTDGGHRVSMRAS